MPFVQGCCHWWSLTATPSPPFETSSAPRRSSFLSSATTPISPHPRPYSTFNRHVQRQKTPVGRRRCLESPYGPTACLPPKRCLEEEMREENASWAMARRCRDAQSLHRPMYNIFKPTLASVLYIGVCPNKLSKNTRPNPTQVIFLCKERQTDRCIRSVLPNLPWEFR